MRLGRAPKASFFQNKKDVFYLASMRLKGLGFFDASDGPGLLWPAKLQPKAPPLLLRTPQQRSDPPVHG
jgi:hypothetical protein